MEQDDKQFVKDATMGAFALFAMYAAWVIGMTIFGLIILLVAVGIA